MKNKIIILRGNCACGKSTTALALRERLGRGAFLIPQDTVRRDMLWVKDVPNNPTVELLTKMVEFGNQNCEYTILDGILYSDIYDSLFHRICELYKDRIFAYYLVAPFDLTVKRQKQRPIHNAFGETEMKRWWRENDLLKVIKEKVINTETVDTETIVKIILKDIVD